MIIGIGGCSRSGKSSLSKLLKAHFVSHGKSVRLIHQDDLVKEAKNIPKIKDRTDWEIPTSMDFHKQLKDIKESTLQFEVIVFEGMLAFYEEKINKHFDVRIFCEVDKFNFLRRKRKDLRFGQDPDWYIEYSWDCFQKYGRTILNHPNEQIRKNVIYIYNHSYEDQWETLLERIPKSTRN